MTSFKSRHPLDHQASSVAASDVTEAAVGLTGRWLTWLSLQVSESTSTSLRKCLPRIHHTCDDSNRAVHSKN